MYIETKPTKSQHSAVTVSVPYPAMAVFSSYFPQLSSITPFSLLSDDPADHLKEAPSHETLKPRYDI